MVRVKLEEMCYIELNELVCFKKKGHIGFHSEHEIQNRHRMEELAWCLEQIDKEIVEIESRLSELEKEELKKIGKWHGTENIAVINKLREVLGKKMKNKSLLEYKDDIKKHFGIDVINIREKKL